MTAIFVDYRNNTR